MERSVLAKNKGISKLYFEVAFCEIENDKHAHQMRASIECNMMLNLNDFGTASKTKLLMKQRKMSIVNMPRISSNIYANPILTRRNAIKGNQK